MPDFDVDVYHIRQREQHTEQCLKWAEEARGRENDNGQDYCTMECGDRRRVAAILVDLAGAVRWKDRYILSWDADDIDGLVEVTATSEGCELVHSQRLYVETPYGVFTFTLEEPAGALWFLMQAISRRSITIPKNVDVQGEPREPLRR